MSLEQVHAVAAPTTLPIAFSLLHQLLIEDLSRALCGGSGPLCEPAALAALRLGVHDRGKERPVEGMMAQRFGDYGAFCALQERVFDATEAYVGGVTPASFDEVLVAAPYPERLAHTFSALVGAERGITRSDALECWVYQHALRHLGGIEHRRSLGGLGGMTS